MSNVPIQALTTSFCLLHAMQVENFF